jgi:hypothetical protein
VSGDCDVTKANPAPINYGPAVGGVNPVANEGDYKNVGKKYQYWAVKLKPYFETQFSLQNKIYDQLLQVDLNFDVTSFKSFFWAEGSIWYQYDSSNPTFANDASTTTNYRNYFLCGGAGITVKPILMSITFAIKLRNCYKTII